MATQRTPLPYWLIAPILRGSGEVWIGIALWIVIGAIVTAAIMQARHRTAWKGALLGAVLGGVGGALLLAPLWFGLVSLLDKRCPACGTHTRPDAATCPRCGQVFGEAPRLDAFVAALSNLTRVVLTIELALLAGGIILELSGKDALDTYRVLFEWGLGTPRARANTLLAATPLIFTGLATLVAFRAGIFNVGVEGSLYLGAFAAAWVGFTFTDLPGVVLIPLALVVAGVVGGLWALIPGFLKARLRVDEVVSTIMLNYVAINFCDYLVTGPFMAPGMSNAMSSEVAAQAQLPRLVERSQFNIGFLVALGVFVIVLILMRRSTFGFEIRMLGSNPVFARWSGLPVGKIIMLVFFASGFIGGLAGWPGRRWACTIALRRDFRAGLATMASSSPCWAAIRRWGCCSRRCSLARCAAAPRPWRCSRMSRVT